MIGTQRELSDSRGQGLQCQQSHLADSIHDHHRQQLHQIPKCHGHHFTRSFLGVDVSNNGTWVLCSEIRSQYLDRNFVGGQVADFNWSPGWRTISRVTFYTQCLVLTFSVVPGPSVPRRHISPYIPSHLTPHSTHLLGSSSR